MHGVGNESRNLPGSPGHSRRVICGLGTIHSCEVSWRPLICGLKTREVGSASRRKEESARRQEPNSGTNMDRSAYYCHRGECNATTRFAGARWRERLGTVRRVRCRCVCGFASVLRLALRKRNAAVWPRILVAGVFIVIGGMLFARWTYGPGLPWWMFYGLPALVTFLVPPVLFRMSGHETAEYVFMAVLMAPAIHVFFSFFVGWHDYMPLFYVRSVWDLLR